MNETDISKKVFERLLMMENLLSKQGCQKPYCVICHQVDFGTPYAKVYHEKTGLKTVCCQGCLDLATRMGFVHITQEV